MSNENQAEKMLKNPEVQRILREVTAATSAYLDGLMIHGDESASETIAGKDLELVLTS